MSKFKDLKKALKQDSSDKVDVACPQCGRVTSFSYTSKIPNRAELICARCKADISVDFLQLAMKQEMQNLKSLKKFLWLILLFAVISLFLFILLLYFMKTAKSVLLVFIALAMIVILLDVFIILNTYSKNKKIKDLYNQVFSHN